MMEEFSKKNRVGASGVNVEGSSKQFSKLILEEISGRIVEFCLCTLGQIPEVVSEGTAEGTQKKKTRKRLMLFALF